MEKIKARAFPGLLSRAAQWAKQQRRLTSLWRRLRWFGPLRNLAARLQQIKDDETPPRDLKTIAALRLPRNEAFAATARAANAVEGMFTPMAMSVIDSLLSFQGEAGITGNFLEFGVFRGRSAVLMGRHLGGQERLVLVDIADYLDRDALAPFRDQIDFILTPTENFRACYPAYGRNAHTFRFIHIDASHAYRATFHELEMADQLLTKQGGIIALDDFANLNYSQNISAIFKYLHTTQTDLTMFLVTDEKAYLCRRRDRGFFAAFVLDRLLAEMEARDIPDRVLSRTETDIDHNTFYVRDRLPKELGNYYAISVYEDSYRRP